MNFKQLRKKLNEAAAPSGEKKIKDFKVGKSKTPAMITKKGSKFVVYIDGTKLDVFKSEKEAQKAADDFAKLMGN